MKTKKPKKQRVYETDAGGCHVMVIEKDLELAIKMLRQKMKSADKIQLLKDKKEYVKPSVKRRKEILLAKFNEQFRNND